MLLSLHTHPRRIIHCQLTADSFELRIAYIRVSCTVAAVPWRVALVP